MNKFGVLSAESDVDRMAVIRSDELHALDEGIIENERKTRVDVSKLVLHNMTSPMHKRISRVKLERRISTARARGNMVALLSQVLREESAILTANRLRWSLIDRM